MAAIDKTYTDKWSDYEAYVAWAKGREFACPNGQVLRPMDYVYDWTESDFVGAKGELPIMNTPGALDYFLIKECPIGFVRDRMREVYDEGFVRSVLDGTSYYDTFERPRAGTRLKVAERPSRRRGCSSGAAVNIRGWNVRRVSRMTIWVTYEGNTMWYDEDSDTFTAWDELGSGASSTAYGPRSERALLRRIRKWGLPVGAVVEAKGDFVGEEWVVKVKGI